jgi:hypothetical protein
MKTKQILIVLSIIMALFIISSQTVASSQTLQAKGTPPGLAKTPGAVATQKAEDRETRVAGNPHGKHENYKGTITAEDASGITLDLKDGTSITIALTAETRIFIPTVKDASVDGLAVGMTAMVQAVRGEDDSLTALKVLLIPGKPATTHRVGIVTEYAEGSSITIQAKDGELYTFLLTEETKILPVERLELLTVGARVTIICPRDVSTLERTATGIVVHPVEVDE